MIRATESLKWWTTILLVWFMICFSLLTLIMKGSIRKQTENQTCRLIRKGWEKGEKIFPPIYSRSHQTRGKLKWCWIYPLKRQLTMSGGSTIGWSMWWTEAVMKINMQVITRKLHWWIFQWRMLNRSKNSLKK